MTIPRNAMSKEIINNPSILDPLNLDETRLFKDRIRDKYCLLEFKNSDTTNEFSISYIINKYRLSYR